MWAVVRLWRLRGIMISTVARDIGSILALGTILPIVITQPNWCQVDDPVQAVCCIVFDPTLCNCLYVWTVSIKWLTIPAGRVS